MDGSVAPIRTRRRPALSCIQCRRRKIKCDRSKPCDQCTQFKISAACAYSQDNTIAAEHHRVAVASLPAASAPGTLSELGFQNSHPALGIEDSDVRPDKLSQLSDVAFRIQNDSAHLISFSETTPRMRGILSKTRFFGQSHWMTILEEFNIMSYFKERLKFIQKGISKDDDAAELIQILERCKALARVLKAVPSRQLFSLPDFNDSVPSRLLSDQLIGLYLRTFESTFRILHIPTFYSEYYRYWNDPQAASPSFVVKLLLVFAIGTSFYQRDDDSGKNLRSQAHQWVYGAQRWLSSPSGKSRLNITGLQINCLLLLARETNGIDDDLIWISAGSVLRMAFNMGLHRDPKHFPHMTIFSSELRRRLWATILEMAVQASLDAGMPPLISIHDFDCGPPSNIDDIDIEEATKNYPLSKPTTLFTQTSIQITLLSSMTTRLEIVRLINDFRVDLPYDEVLRLGADLTKACRENSLMMQSYISSPELQYGICPTNFHKNLLDIFTRRFLLALHRPFAIKAKTDPRFYFSRKICLESAMVFTSYVGDLAPLPNIQDDFTRLAVMGGGSVDGAILHDAAMSVCFELISQLDEEMSNSLSNDPVTQPSIINQLSRTAREPLIRAVELMVQLAECRVSVGETNVKGHLFLSAMMAQINAMETGMAPETAILKSAKEAAATCYELLRARTASIPGDSGNQFSTDTQSNPSTGIQQNLGYDIELDSNMNFDVQDSWFFSGWDENDAWI